MRACACACLCVFVVENLQRTAHMDMLNNFKNPLFDPERVLEDRGVEVCVCVRVCLRE